MGTNATRKCFLYRSNEQDDNALFYQIMCVLNGGSFPTLDKAAPVVPDLEDVIFYADFSGIFDHSRSQRYLERQRKAESLFRPEGIALDFGTGPHTYLAFERSGSMSRQAKLSFLRADVYDDVRRRILLDMTIGECQLSKLYAYLGLMLSGGARIDGVELTKPHWVIVVDNPTFTVEGVDVITVEGGETDGGMRRYARREMKMPVEVTAFDGEGLISKRFARTVDKVYCGERVHSSFQIRMPFVKGMLHLIDIVQFQTPIFSENTKGAWVLRFDDVLGDALELGPLQNPGISFSSETERKIEQLTPEGVPADVILTLTAYYLANRQEDMDWVVLPVANFDAYLGGSFSRKWLPKLPKDVVVRERERNRGMCRYQIQLSALSIEKTPINSADKKCQYSSNPCAL